MGQRCGALLDANGALVCLGFGHSNATRNRTDEAEGSTSGLDIPHTAHKPLIIEGKSHSLGGFLQVGYRRFLKQERG